jgi:hypothetical protein
MELPMRTHHPIVRRSFLAAVLALVAGCSASTTPAILSSESDVTRGVAPGLDQRVTLSPTTLVTGENVTIHSVITNRGSNAISLQSRICGLDIESDMPLPHPPDIGFCGGHSMGGAIAPGETRESTDIRRVSAAAGSYTLRVRHALQPDRWVEMRVAVRAR